MVPDVFLFLYISALALSDRFLTSFLKKNYIYMY